MTTKKYYEDTKQNFLDNGPENSLIKDDDNYLVLPFLITDDQEDLTKIDWFLKCRDYFKDTSLSVTQQLIFDTSEILIWNQCDNGTLTEEIKKEIASLKKTLTEKSTDNKSMELDKTFLKKTEEIHEQRLYKKFLNCFNHAILNPTFYNEFGVDREDWIDNLIWKNEEKKELHPFLKKEIQPAKLGYKILDYLIRYWFLPRYDFEGARTIINIFQKENGKEKFNIFWKSREYFTSLFPNKFFEIPLIFAPFIIALIFSNAWNSFIDCTKFPLLFKGGVYNFNTVNSANTIYAVYNTPEIFFEFLFISQSLIFLCFSKSNPLFQYLISPRLFIGILLGYLTLFSGSTYWSFSILSFSSSISFAVISSASLLVIVYLYIRYEVKKAIGYQEDRIESKKSVKDKNYRNTVKTLTNREKLTIRSLEYFRKALWSSFFIGLVILDIFFVVYLKIIKSELGVDGFKDLSTRFHTGIIGIIDPILLLFFFPLALIIGVVIKFILDEKPITHPIK